MLGSAIFLGLMASGALIILFTKLPMFIQRLFLKHPLISEILSLVFFYFSITSITQSLIGVMGAFAAGIIWTIFFFAYRYNKLNTPLQRRQHNGPIHGQEA